MEETNIKEELRKKGKDWGSGGGLYRGVKANVKTLNYVIVVLVIVLVGVVVYLSSTSSYKLSYEMNGGEARDVENYKYGDRVNKQTPTKTGYTFAGWYQDQDLTKLWDVNQDTVKESTMLYAKWKPSKIHILLDVNGGYLEESSKLALDVEFHAPYGLLPYPTKEGTTFIGWKYNGEMIDNTSIVQMNGEHTLQAVYK